MPAHRLRTSNHLARRAVLLAVTSMLLACDRASVNDRELADGTTRDSVSEDSTALDRASDAPAAVAFADSLAPVRSWFSAAESALRANAGTSRADSTLIALRASLSDSVNKAVAGLDVGDTISATLRARGVAVREAEGMRSYSPSEGALLERLGPLLTEPMREYLALRAREQENRAASDGALVITYEELLDRLRAADAFARTHDTHMQASSARGQANWYLAVALAGLPNFTVFDRNTRVFSESYRASLEQFVRDNPGTPAAARIDEFLVLLRESSSRRTARVDASLQELWREASVWVFE